MELNAAYLLSQLIKKVIEATSISFTSIHAFTDSRIVLDWIKGNPKRWKTFVATRVIKINENSSKTNWHHVSTSENPADCASRGIYPNELNDHSLWWYGPQFLQSKNIIVEMPIAEDETAIDVFNEERPIYVMNAVIESDILPDVLSYGKLKRIIAQCLRFASKCKKQAVNKYISAQDLEKAEIQIMKSIQKSAFAEEISCLMKGNEIKNTVMF